MLERVEIHGWQSLRSATLELGRFTVIVGASSSGKSALIRALRAVSSNMRGSGQITRGAKKAAITVRTDRHVVTLERAETSGCYRIVDTATGAEQVFTKLAGQVPDEVTAALRIAPTPTGGTSINFAGQFDRPYLLDESGATVARVLGELTNITTIFEAVREANRRRNDHAATLRTRQVDVDRLRGQLGRFTNLPTRLALCENAETTARAAQDTASRIKRLRWATDTLTAAEAVLARQAALPEVPDPAGVLDTASRLTRCTALLRALVTATTRAAAAHAAIGDHSAAEATLHQQLHDTLTTAGMCPTCLRPVA